MIWLVSQLWPVALVSVLAGFVITWFSVTRRYNPATDPDRPKRRRVLDDATPRSEGDDAPSRTTGDAATDDETAASPETPRQVGVELRSPRSRTTGDRR